MELNNKVTVFIPSTFEGNKSAKRMQRKESKRASKFFCSLYGGATATPATGFYMSDSKGMIKEKQILIYSNCTRDGLNTTIKGVKEYCKRLCKRMKQECISLDINGTLYFIEG